MIDLIFNDKNPLPFLRKNKIIFISGNFNVIHPGHIRLFTFAKSLGGDLVVALFPDGSEGVYVPSMDRHASIRSLSVIKHSFILSTSLLEVIKSLKPDIVLKGGEHASEHNPERVVVESYGGEIIFASGESWESYFSFSDNFPSHRFYLTHDGDYLKRHNIKRSRLKSIIEKFSSLNIMVIGDTIVDEYISVEPIGMSREDVSIITTPIDSARYLGGAGVVAAQAAALGSNTNFFSMTGSDDLRGYVCDELNRKNISYILLKDTSRPTTLKTRYQCQNKTLFRLSKLRHHPINPQFAQDLYAQVESKLNGCNALIFSDFSYGFLGEDVVKLIIELANKLGILVVADSQSSSQIGNLAKFIGANLITPTEYEARQTLDNYAGGLAGLATALVAKLECDYAFITLGKEGLLVQDSRNDFATDNIKALNSNPINVSGAGDTLLAIATLALASGASIWEAAYLGSIGAGVKVSTAGNSPISIKEMQAGLMSK
jgi:rfaE bifunctional protein kinase chain/domain